MDLCDAQDLLECDLDFFLEQTEKYVQIPLPDTTKETNITIKNLIMELDFVSRKLSEMCGLLATSNNENKKLCIEYSSLMKRYSELETALELVQQKYKDYKNRATLETNHKEAYQSHINQLQMLVKEYEESLVDYKKILKEKDLCINNKNKYIKYKDKCMKDTDLQISAMRSDIAYFIKQCSQSKKNTKKFKSLQRKYSLKSKDFKEMDYSMEEISDNEIDVFETSIDSASSPEVLVLNQPEESEHSQKSIQTFKEDPKLVDVKRNKNDKFCCIDTMRDLDNTNEVVSEDTGCGSSLAFSDSISTHSPDNYISDSPFSTDFYKNGEKTLVNRATSPIIAINQMWCSRDVSTNTTFEDFLELMQTHKRDKASSPIKELALYNHGDESTRFTGETNIITDTSRLMVSLIDKPDSHNTSIEQVFDSNNLSNDDSVDYEIQDILKAMTFTRELITPLPTTPENLTSLGIERRSSLIDLQFEETTLLETRQVLPERDDESVKNSPQVFGTLQIQNSLLDEKSSQENHDIEEATNSNTIESPLKSSNDSVLGVNVRKLSKLQRFKNKCIPKSKIRSVTPPIKKVRPGLKPINSKVNNKQIDPMTSKEKAIKIMAEISKQKELNNEDLRVTIPANDRITLNNNETNEQLRRLMPSNSETKAEIACKKTLHNCTTEPDSANNLCMTNDPNKKLQESFTTTTPATTSHSSINQSNDGEPFANVDTQSNRKPAKRVLRSSTSKSMSKNENITMKDDNKESLQPILNIQKPCKRLLRNSTIHSDSADENVQYKKCYELPKNRTPNRKVYKKKRLQVQQNRSVLDTNDKRCKNVIAYSDLDIFTNTPSVDKSTRTNRVNNNNVTTNNNQKDITMSGDKNKNGLELPSNIAIESDNVEKIICPKGILKDVGADTHNSIISYSDMDMFTDNVTPVQCGDNNSESVKQTKGGILCMMIERHGKVTRKQKAVRKQKERKVSDSNANKVCAIFNERISDIIKLTTVPHHENIKPEMDRLIVDMRKWSHEDLTMGAVKYLMEPQRKVELFNKIHTPPAPAMTKGEQILLYVLLELRMYWPSVDLIESIMLSVEYLLFQLNRTPDFDAVESMSHFYAILCTYRGQLRRLRSFMMDAMYCIQYKSVTVIKQCLDVNMHVLPLAHQGLAKITLVTGLVYLLHFYKCDDRYKKVQDIRFTLNKKYFYKTAEWNEMRTLENLKKSIMELRDNELQKKMLSRILILLGKRHGWQWCHNHIITNILQPIIDNTKVGDNVRRFCVSMIGPLIKPFPTKEMNVHIDCILNSLANMLHQEQSPKMQEAIITSLIHMSRHNGNCVNQVLLSWKPQTDVSAELEYRLRRYVREKPVTTWKTVLCKSSNVN